MGNPTVRILSTSDADLCRDLQRECLPGDVPINKGQWWVAFDGATAIGFVCLVVEADYGYIARTGVVPKARGQRLQRRMQFVAEKAARLQGCTWMVSDTASWNHASSNTFIGMGYKLYDPAHKWGWADGLYWRKPL